MKPRRSILSYVLVAFVFTYSVLNIANFVRSNDSYYNQHLNERKSDLISYLSLASMALKNNDLVNLKPTLEEAVRLGRIDYVVLKGADGDSVQIPANKHLPSFDAASINKNSVSENDTLLIGSLVAGENSLLVVSHKSRMHYLEFTFNENKWSLLADIAIVMLVIGLIVSHYLRDIRELTAKLGTPGKKGFSSVATLSAEAQTLKRGLQGFEAQVDSMKARFQLLDANTLPALKDELFSGKEPPYDFECTLVRTDINSYSTALNKIGGELYLPYVNDFFVRLTRVVDRYGGHIKEFLGDEAIYYFKDGARQSSIDLALAALRDIQEEATQVEREALERIGCPFTVKSSLSHGSLHFGPLVHQINLSGALFIETVRLLNEATAKDRSQILLLKETAAKAGSHADISFLKHTKLKGFSDEVAIYDVSRFKDVGTLLKTAGTDLANLSLYRMDQHLVAIFEWLTLRYDSLSAEEVSSALDILKAQSLRALAPQVIESYCALVGAWQSRVLGLKESDRKDLLWQLSSLTTLAYRWKFELDLKATVRDALLPNFSIPDDRVIANTIDAFVALMPTEPEPIVAMLTDSENNRIRANALVKQGLTSLDSKVLDQLGALVMSYDPFKIASGLYALSEIACHYRSLDPVYFDANLRMQRLIERAQACLSHENEMVRRQALRLSALLSETYPPKSRLAS